MLLAESDLVKIVSLVTGCITAIALPLIAYFQIRSNQNQAKAAVKVQEVAIKQEEATKEVKEVKTVLKESNAQFGEKLDDHGKQLRGVKEEVHKIEVATNSMKDAQVDLSRKLGVKEGEQIGRADQRAETKADAADAKPAAAENVKGIIAEYKADELKDDIAGVKADTETVIEKLKEEGE